MNIPNSPTTNYGYEYTDDDFAEATQPYWISIELEQEKSEETIRREKIEAWYEKYGELEEEAREAALREEEEERRWNEHNEVMYSGQADYEFDNLDENRTPDGWPETFYEF